MENPFPKSIKNIGILSLSGIPNEDLYSRGIETLRTFGINPVLPSVRTPSWRYLATTDDERVRQLHEYLNNPEVDAILMTNGGYGCARVLDKIDWELMRARNIPIIGYSDVTALHLAALRHGCRNHIHAPMLTRLFAPRDDSAEEARILAQTADSLKGVFEKRQNLVSFDEDKLVVLKEGGAEGPIVPVNLTMLCSLIGTNYMPQLLGSILAVEDVGEAPYRIDRMLTQLEQTGILPRLRGLIFGKFVDMEDDYFLDDVMSEFAQKVHGPVIKGLTFGHVTPSVCVPVGAQVILTASKEAGASLELSPLAQYESQMAVVGDHTLGYEFLQPKTVQEGKEYPLLLFLHGAGERGIENCRQFVHVVSLFSESTFREHYPCYAVVPQCPVDMQWVQTPWDRSTPHEMPAEASWPLDAVWQIVQDIAADYPIDSRRIYIMGISMGGYGTWDMIMRHPDFFAAAVPICGGADDSKAALIKDMPIWAFHGSEDATVPTVRSRSIVAALKAIGSPIRYTEYPGIGHNSWSSAIAEPALFPWLFSQVRN